MTCREFKHEAATLRLPELMQAQDAALMAHTESCVNCGAWFEKQRTLAASTQALRVRTSGLEAGPDVERALLRAFRQSTALAVGPANIGSAAREAAPAKRSLAAPGSTPIAWRMSRWFGFGAYAAAAATLAIAIFLGAELLKQHQSAATIQSASAPAAQQNANEAAAPASTAEAQQPVKRVVASSGAVKLRRVAANNADASVSTTAAQAEEADYIPLMLCDPLSCGGDAQVVRMQLPESQQMADVIVGYDGLVRAVRLVN
jgi:hypothetical protein